MSIQNQLSTAASYLKISPNAISTRLNLAAAVTAQPYKLSIHKWTNETHWIDCVGICVDVLVFIARTFLSFQSSLNGTETISMSARRKHLVLMNLKLALHLVTRPFPTISYSFSYCLVSHSDSVKHTQKSIFVLKCT